MCHKIRYIEIMITRRPDRDKRKIYESGEKMSSERDFLIRLIDEMLAEATCEQLRVLLAAVRGYMHR